MDTTEIEAKLVAARTKLILDKPFLGALVLRLPMVAAKAEWCPTTATDAKTFYYSPDYIAGLTAGQAQFVLSHEALHCALSHFARRSHRIKHRWDVACDFAINPLLIEDGLQPPADALALDEYVGMTAEEIYPLIEDADQLETHDRHLYDTEHDSGSASPPPERTSDQTESGADGADDKPATEPSPDTELPREPNAEPQGGNPQLCSKSRIDGDQAQLDELADAPPPLSAQEKETLQVQWQQRLAGAAQQALQAGKMGGSLARLVDHLLQPQLPWRMLLARYMTGLARDDFSYMRPSRREGDAILPSLRSSQVDMVVAIDTSGSIKAEEIGEFLSEVSAIKGQMRARITLLPCDAQLADEAPWIYEPWEDLSLPDTVQGGGGTDFRPVFDWLAAAGATPDLLVYFTDAAGFFPAKEPNFPVIWLVKGKELTPWGQRVQLN
jgi:predicted metal-dependent peptidase